MNKKLGLLTLALVSALILIEPTRAKAGEYVGFGVAIAPPVYAYPAYPYADANPYYCDPYANPYCGYSPYAYVSPYLGWGGGYWGGGRGYYRGHYGYAGRYGYRGGYGRGGYGYRGSGFRGGYAGRGGGGHGGHR